MKTTNPTASFTPGPWEYEQCADGRHHTVAILSTAYRANEASPYHPMIAQALTGRGHADMETATANARLIASAPDLLAALERAERALTKLGMMDEVMAGTVGKSSTLHQARAAIAKAKG